MRRLALASSCVLLLAACRDEAAEAFARAQLQYDALVAQGAGPDDARFDPVLAELRRVPPTSKRYERAQALARGIEGGRVRVRTPLALAARGHRPPELEAQLAACARLAELAGSDGGVQQRALEALEDCRRKTEALELSFAHAHEAHDAGGHP